VADDGLLASMETAVTAAPDDVPLRLHLADLLLAADLAARALEHAVHALTRAPSSREAIDVARRAALAAGLRERAEGYERLLAALGSSDDATEVEPPAPGMPVAEHAGEVDDEFDVFLRDVLSEAGTELERPTVTLADVGGLESVKRRLHTSFIGPMTNRELRRMYGTSLRGGLLLYGPPGCGKTFLARAVAGEIGAHFFAIGLHDVLDMWLGQSERNLHAIFETARRSTPCVLFLDEVDALGMKRSNLARSAGRNVVVQLLAELDSMTSENEGIFVLGATNQPWDLDPALRRPGRFDRTLLVLPPDNDARVAILRFHLRDRPVADIDLVGLARRTDGYSGADLRLLTDDAAERALEDSITSGSARPIAQADLEAALRAVRPSTKAWFEAARSFVMFANQAGEYDDLLAYMREKRLS
jgi:SpoVK/Ycf46/Vps4 family AAA+-type ATPase